MRFTFISFVIVLLLTTSCHQSFQNVNQTVDLSGTWNFQLDSTNVGIEDKWYSRLQTDKISLPGTTDIEQKGKLNTKNEIGCFTRLFPYSGPAWYQREIEIQKNWNVKELIFLMELTKASSVWVDDHFIGREISLTAPHSYNLTQYLTPGKHLLSVRIDNSDNPPVKWGHQTSDETQTNWNGILGRIELQIKDPVWMTDVQVFPDIDKKKVNIKVRFNKKCTGKLTLQASSWNTNTQHKVEPKSVAFETSDEREYETSMVLGENMQLWDEFNPALYKLKIQFSGNLGGIEVNDYKETDFGMRKFTTNGSQFQVNGKAVFLRGKHEAHVFPITGHVPMEVDEWVRIFKISKSYGMNHYRYHTCIPSKAEFAAADRVGIYLEPQLPIWDQVGDSQQSFSLEDVEIKKDSTDASALVKYMLFEGYKILGTFGNHASFCMFSLGNELHGDRKLLSQMVSKFRSSDNRHLYASGSNNFIWSSEFSPGDDYWTTTYTGGHYKAGNFFPDTKGKDVRSSYPVHTFGQINNVYPNTLYTYSEGIKNVPVPVISHENGQFQVYPDFNEIKKFTGVVRAKNYEMYKDRLEKAGMLDQANDFFRASGALSALCYRADIETAIRTKGFGGFQLLDLQDFPGQGTALIGMLDVFMDSKGLIAPEKWREFCSETVPLLKMEKYTWTNDEKFNGLVSFANYGPDDVNSTIKWEIIDKTGKVLTQGEMKVESPQGKLSDLKPIIFDLSDLKTPQKLEIKLSISNTTAKNSYPVWVYPSKVETKAPKGIKISRILDKDDIATLENGGKILLLPDSTLLKNSIGGAFQSDFWCYPMFKKYHPPGTLGILCEPRHPVFNEFPTDSYSNWQWWPMLKNGKVMILDTTPVDFRPIVQVIDNFERNHKLGVIFECKVGKGKLLVCSCNLQEQENYPEARQLLHSILDYMSTNEFQPAQNLDLADLNKILNFKK
jgi:hypothetical protein